MSKKRILHIWQAGYPWEVRIEKINSALIALGYEVAVLCRHQAGEASIETKDGVTIYRVGEGLPRFASLPIPGNPVWKKALKKVVRQFKPMALLLRDIPLATQTVHVAKEFNLPVILDMAEHYPEAMRSWQKYAQNPVLKKLVHDWKLPDKLEAWTVPQMSAVIVVCDEQKQRLIQEYHFDGKKMATVLNTPAREQWRTFKKGSSNKNPHCFGYHGILCEDRELENILQGFEIGAEQNAEVTLLIAGGGESEEKLRALAQTLKHKNRIRFTGKFKPEDRGRLYDEVDFGIVSLRANVFTEHTLANKFFDYAALGKPFIFTKLKPLQTVMNQMHCGLAFEPGKPESVAKAMLQLMQENYEKLSQNGIQAIDREFHWEKDVQRIEAILAALFPSPNG